jgi:hypothetical protein
MSILIGALEFDGPHFDFDCLSDEAGIYAVVCQTGEEFELVELGDAEHIRESLLHHPDRHSWMDNCENLAVAVHYTTDITAPERQEIRRNLEEEYDVQTAA